VIPDHQLSLSLQNTFGKKSAVIQTQSRLKKVLTFEWSRLSEKKKNRKDKGKRKVTTPEKPQSALEQWYEIWVILFPDIEAPPTPCE
jgi:hypothetical protein